MPLPARRKKFKFQVPPSDNELWAIGAVAVQWSQLESFMTGFVHAMSEKDSEERKLFDSTRSFKDRVRQWEVLIRAKMQQPQATNLLAIVTRIKNAQQMRDRIMHATWAGEAIPNSDDMTAKGVFNWTKPRQPFEWDLDFGKIMFVATTLDGIAYDLMAGIAQMTPKGKFMTLSEALQQILRKPDQSP